MTMSVATDPSSTATGAQRPVLSIVLPIFNEEEVIPELGRRLAEFLASLEVVGPHWEVLLVNDGSHDRSPAMLDAMANSDRRYKVIHLSRNFGHQAAITAGLDWASGEAVVVMDADLQDPPEVVREMLARWREGYDVVYGVRSKRHGETIFKRLSAALFYRLLVAALGVSIPIDAGDFRLLSRPVVLTLRALRERHRFMRGLVAWLGFRQIAVTYERPERFAGETKYPFRKMLRFAFDGITSFSIVPLRAATWLGLGSGFVAVVLAGWAFYVGLFTSRTVPGWTTLMILIAVTSSIQMLIMGMLGEYVGRIYEEVKRRPLYVISSDVNMDVQASEPRERPAA